MSDARKVFLVSAGGTPDALREVTRLLRAGWRVSDARPADRATTARLADQGMGPGPFSVVVMEAAAAGQEAGAGAMARREGR